MSFVQCSACGIHAWPYKIEPELGEICERCSQTPTKFSTDVLERVMRLRELNRAVRLLVNRDAVEMEQQGYTQDDATAFILCTEEVSPDLDEKTALNRMHAIAKKYPQHLMCVKRSEHA